MTREIETWLSDSRVGNNSVVDHKSRRPFQLYRLDSLSSSPQDRLCGLLTAIVSSRQLSFCSYLLGRIACIAQKQSIAATDVARLSICFGLYVRLPVWHTDKPCKIGRTDRDGKLVWDQEIMHETAMHIGATSRIPLNYPCATAMRFCQITLTTC